MYGDYFNEDEYERNSRRRPLLSPRIRYGARGDESVCRFWRLSVTAEIYSKLKEKKNAKAKKIHSRTHKYTYMGELYFIMETPYTAYMSQPTVNKISASKNISIYIMCL